MARRLLLDEFHVTFFAPRRLTAGEVDAIRRTLDNAGFRAALRRAVRQSVRQFPLLNQLRMRLSR